MADLDRERAAALMAAAGLDALALFQPEAFRYATGLDDGAAGMWRRAGPAIALVPADPGQKSAAILSDHAAQFVRPGPDLDLVTHRIWIDFVAVPPLPEGPDMMPAIASAYAARGLGGPRPETFDFAGVCASLGDLLAGRGLARGRVGVDLEFMPVADFAALKAALPQVEWLDGSEVLRRLRCVKSPAEIARLVDASDISEDGMEHMAAALRDGMPVSRLNALWREGVAAGAARRGRKVTGIREGIAVGPDLSLPDPVVAPGALIKADMGVAVDGYLSDGTRTWCWGQPSPAALRLYGILEQAFAAGLARIGPGVALGEVHAAVLEVTRRHGLTDYCRGHFGHSIGGSHGSEEWPFISAGNPEPMLPGMMLAFETPFYGQGLGAMMIEDQVLVTATGARVINRLPRGLGRLDG